MNTGSKFRATFEQAPVGMACVSVAGDLIAVNQRLCELFGYSREELLAVNLLRLTDLHEGSRKLDVLQTLLAGNLLSYTFERRYLRKDAHAIWVKISISPIWEATARELLHFVAVVEDITEFKRVQELRLKSEDADRNHLETDHQQLSVLVMDAQDRERRRIAAELTDSLGQAVSGISIEASKLLRIAEGEIKRGLELIAAKIRDVTTGIGIIAQGLYPSGLDFAGLPWAIEGLCRQFTHLERLQVDFKHEGMYGNMPSDVALCLYRIVQEGLRNVVQHSGTRRAWIELISKEEKVTLHLWDEGVSFDSASVSIGLGLLRMRELCRRLNGSFKIHTQSGTRLEVEIPLTRFESGTPNLPTGSDLDE
jgi:two-component system sensor histidine kinase UhpB